MIYVFIFNGYFYIACDLKENITDVYLKLFHVAPYTPVGRVEDLFPRSWFLEHVDEKHRRRYSFTPDSPCIKLNGCLSKLVKNIFV